MSSIVNWSASVLRAPLNLIAGSGNRSGLWRRLSRVAAVLLLVTSVICLLLSFFWSREPDLFDIRTNSLQQLGTDQPPVGAVTVATLIRVADVLLHKDSNILMRGGYLSNDIMPPGVWMDNIPNWEFGVLVQVRDLTRSLRSDFSRSQSQSAQDADVVAAENSFYIRNDQWILPQTEAEYRKGIKHLRSYLIRLNDSEVAGAQFYARADNLRNWLAEVETRLGSLSQRLSASVGKRQLDTSLAGDANARQSTATDPEVVIKTPWLELDDVFYEARGTTWALIHLLRAIEHDFAEVLQDKNAAISLQQIIRELEATQLPVWSPVILNGGGATFGIINNHSLVMASYVSRANAAIINLRNLLEQG